LAENIETDQ